MKHDSNNETKKPVPVHFIVSSPRSGTNWLNSALNQHPEIFATENRLFGDFADLWPARDGTLQPRITFDRFMKNFSQHYDFESLGMNRNRFLRTFQRSFHNFLVRYSLSHSDKSVFVDKITPYHDTADLVIESIVDFFPDAKLIQLVRDGRDVATSGAFDWLLRDAQGTDRYSYFVERRPGVSLRRFFDDELLRTWAKYWSEPLLAIERGSLEPVVVRYEEMKMDQGKVIERICEHFGVACSTETANECADSVSFSKTTGREPGDADNLAKSRKGIVGDWKNYFTRRDGELFHELVGEKLIELGYASDADWHKHLPETLEMQPLE